MSQYLRNSEQQQLQKEEQIQMKQEQPLKQQQEIQQIIENKNSFQWQSRLKQGKNVHFERYLEMKFFINGKEISKDTTLYEIVQKYNKKSTSDNPYSLVISYYLFSILIQSNSTTRATTSSWSTRSSCGKPRSKTSRAKPKRRLYQKRSTISSTTSATTRRASSSST